MQTTKSSEEKNNLGMMENVRQQIPLGTGRVRCTNGTSQEPPGISEAGRPRTPARDIT